jgi:DNA polymerase family A
VPAKPKNILFYDCETYYDTDYSLNKMPTPSYILDPRFELQMVAVKLNDAPHQVIRGPDFPQFLASVDPTITTTVNFNALFDASILAWRYGWVPHTMLDAMGMARALLGHELKHGVSLRAVAEYMYLGHKGHALQKVMGLRLAQIESMGLYPEFAAYAEQDNFLLEQIFLRLIPSFPWSERRLMDMVLRCAVTPRFQCDVPMMEQHLADVEAEKNQLLIDANGVDPKTIMSTPKFKAALEALGVTVEMKQTASGVTPAFAKTDEFMEELTAHADPQVQALALARLGFKSTLEETRTRKLLHIAGLDWSTWNAYRGGKGHRPFMPIPLAYGKAHTHRLAGEWKMNMQNMPTVRGSKGKSKLRQSLVVADDECVVTCDLSQIEARLSAWICGCSRLIDEFANKKDPYSQLANDIFGYAVNRKLKDAQGNLVFPIEGFIGKTGILGLGYGAGKDKFDTMVIQSARKDGLDISKIYNRSLGDKAVDSYRRRYGEIPRGWSTLDMAVRSYWLSGSATYKFGPVEISYGTVMLPSGLALRYADPQQYVDPDTGRVEYKYRYGKTWHKIYGAKLLENIVQALARIVVMNAALRIRDRGIHTVNPEDYRFSHQAHDELVFVVKKDHLDEVKKIVMQEMTRRPSWAPDAPIDAELGVGSNYGEAK